MKSRYEKTMNHFIDGLLTSDDVVEELIFLVLSYMECKKIGLAKANSLLKHIYEWGKGEDIELAKYF